MKNLGMAGSALPRAKAGEFENALGLLAALAKPKATKASLLELQDATAAADKAREDAEASTAKAQQRESAAQKAEAAATVGRQALADETARSEAALGNREKQLAAREVLAADVEAAQDVRDKELAAREAHLREAGVQGF